MAQHAHVPKFGNWEGDDNVSYTQFFENERKGRTGGKLINANGRQQKPNVFPKGTAAVTASPLRNASDSEIQKSKYEQITSKGDAGLHCLSDSPTHHDAVVWKPTTDGFRQWHKDWRASGDHGKTNKMCGGSERNIERLPLHPHYLVKPASKDGAPSPKGSSAEAGHGHRFAPSPGTPGRSKLKTVDRGNQPADKGSIVPKFGDWDESNPSSADGFTRMFDKVREGKQVGTAKIPITKTDPDSHKQDCGNSDSSICLCFSWCQKT